MGHSSVQLFFFTVKIVLCNLNLDFCNMPEFNLSNSYQKNTLCPGSAVIFRVAESLINGTKGIADVTALWFSQMLTRNQTKTGGMRNSSLILHTEVPISHKVRDYLYNRKTQTQHPRTEIHSKDLCMQPPKQGTLRSQGPTASFQNEGEMNTYNTQLLQQDFSISLFED